MTVARADVALLEPSNVSILERPAKLLATLVCIDVFLVAMYAVSVASGSAFMLLLFNMDQEFTIVAWYASMKLLAVGLLLWVAAEFSDRPYWPRPVFLRAVALGFMFLSLDETAAIHERLTHFGEAYAWVPRLAGTHGTWIFLYTAIGATLIVLAWRDIWTLCVYHMVPAMLMGGGFAILVAGAVLVEAAGYYGLFGRGPLQIAPEEFLELLGVSVILAGATMLFGETVKLGRAG